ncbi:UNVERIFIED_CONTAM: hypothetical protein NCL1_09032 [Trichonephila clavipes]
MRTTLLLHVEVTLYISDKCFICAALQSIYIELCCCFHVFVESELIYRPEKVKNYIIFENKISKPFSILIS